MYGRLCRPSITRCKSFHGAVSKKYNKMSCCGGVAREFSDKVYYEPCAHDVFEERSVALGEKQNMRHVMNWLPSESKSVKALVVIAHGLHEHGLRYYSLAHALTAKNFGVYALDHIGHGRSSPLSDRGFVPCGQTLVDDFVGLAEFARGQHGDGTIPLYVVGHSMGTLITIMALGKIPNVSATVFSGCALQPGTAAASPFGVRSLYPFFQGELGPKLTSVMAAVAPRAPAAPIDINGITSDAEQIKILKEDPHRYDSEVMNKTAYEALKLSLRAKENVNSNVTMPIYIVHGEDDEICYPSGSEFLRDYAATPLEHVSCEYFKGQRHEVFHEKKVDGANGDKVVLAIVNVVKFLEQQYENREEIAADLKATPKRGIPTLAHLLPPVTMKDSSAKSPQTRVRTKLEIGLSTSNNVIR